MCNNKPMAPYAKLPELEEYKEWFKDFADLYREDGILQVTWKTNDGPMHHSGMSHRAIGQLVRVLSLDFKNEIIIFTHIGDNWMTESDPNGWETYSELPTQRFQHQYFDDTNLIKNMVFDLDVPTIGAVPGPGFHWDSAFLSDVTICTEDTVMVVTTFCSKVMLAHKTHSITRYQTALGMWNFHNSIFCTDSHIT